MPTTLVKILFDFQETAVITCVELPTSVQAFADTGQHVSFLLLAQTLVWPVKHDHNTVLSGCTPQASEKGLRRRHVSSIQMTASLVVLLYSDY